MRLADKARAKRDKAPWARGTLQFHSLAAPQTLRKLPDIVHGKPYPITREDDALVWPDMAELVNDICVKSGVLVSDPQGFPLSFLDELQKRFRRESSTESLDEFERTGKVKWLRHAGAVFDFAASLRDATPWPRVARVMLCPERVFAGVATVRHGAMSGER